MLLSCHGVSPCPRARRRRQTRGLPRAQTQSFASHSSAKKSGNSALVIGEVLWDALPDALFLGGAPVNVGVHLQQLGHIAKVATRVGDDALGEEILRRLVQRDVSTDLVQVDKSHRTGFVKVVLKDAEPTYDIVSPSAWDFIDETPELVQAASAADVVIYGSLAQRSEVSRRTIQAAAARAKRAVFDVNLRPPFTDGAVIAAGLKSAWLIKLNAAEAALVLEEHVPGGAAGAASAGKKGAPELARAIGQHFGCHVCVTAGGDGAALWDCDLKAAFSHAGCKVTPVDFVGAGDSFLAALVDGMLREGGPDGRDRKDALAFANAVGAFVASQRGATPALDWKAVEELVRASPAPSAMAA